MKWILFFSCWAFFLEAEILQTKEIKDLLQHVNERTWVFFDIDDTILTSSYEAGRTEYYLFDFNQLKEQGMEDDLVHEICRLRWEQMQNAYPVKCMELNTKEVVHQVQNLAGYAIGLTARGPQTCETTKKHLHSLGLDFSGSAPLVINGDLLHRHLYDSGIWFVEFNHKGLAVRQWLNTLDEYPEKIVFVDDRRVHLENMEKELAGLPIEYIGVHYAKVLERPFNPRIAQIQGEFFPQILSNEEAQRYSDAQ